MRIALLSPKGPLYRYRKGIFRRSLRYAPLTLTTLASLIPEELRGGLTILDEGIQEIDPELEAQAKQPLRPNGHLLPFSFRDPGVRRIANIPYAPEHGFRGKLDVYVPRAGASRAPVLFQVHGGGWSVSQKGHQALPLMNHLAKAGWVCVAPNYRLSPRATFPDHLVDLKRALLWIRENIAGYGGDPDFAAQAAVVTTVVSAATVPLWLLVLQAL